MKKRMMIASKLIICYADPAGNFTFSSYLHGPQLLCPGLALAMVLCTRQ